VLSPGDRQPLPPWLAGSPLYAALAARCDASRKRASRVLGTPAAPAALQRHDADFAALDALSRALYIEWQQAQRRPS
jgi:hypothetical protein